MKSNKPISDAVKREIEVRAYLIWESEGRPHGREVEHWQRAEAEILGAKKPAAKKKKTTKAKANGKVAVSKTVVTAKTKKTAKPKAAKPHSG